MASNDGSEGPPKPFVSPHKLWTEAAGNHDRYIQLMIEHGHIIPLPKVDLGAEAVALSVNPVDPADPVLTGEPDSWAQVAFAAKAMAEAHAPLCPKCRRLVVLTEKGFVKVHFAKVEDARPCPGSYQAWTG